jgi:hypothetical protein
MAKSMGYSLAKTEAEKADRYEDRCHCLLQMGQGYFSKGCIPYKRDLTLTPLDRTTVFDIYHQSAVYSTKCIGPSNVQTKYVCLV